MSIPLSKENSDILLKDGLKFITKLQKLLKDLENTIIKAYCTKKISMDEVTNLLTKSSKKSLNLLKISLEAVDYAEEVNQHSPTPSLMIPALFSKRFWMAYPYQLKIADRYSFGRYNLININPDDRKIFRNNLTIIYNNMVTVVQKISKLSPVFIAICRVLIKDEFANLMEKYASKELMENMKDLIYPTEEEFKELF